MEDILDHITYPIRMYDMVMNKIIIDMMPPSAYIWAMERIDFFK